MRTELNYDFKANFDLILLHLSAYASDLWALNNHSWQLANTKRWEQKVVSVTIIAENSIISSTKWTSTLFEAAPKL